MLLIENNDLSDSVFVESSWQPKQKGFHMCEPESGKSYNVLVKPGEMKIIVIQNEAQYSDVNGLFRATLINDKTPMKEENRVDPKIIDRCLEHGTK